MAVELYDEHEQGERVRKWIREYAPAIVMGLVLAFAGIFGFGQWQQYQAGQSAMAADYHELVRQELTQGNLNEAQAQFEVMRESVRRNAYTGLAGMRLAAALVEDGQLARAERIYRDIINERRLRSLWPVATLRLARILEAQGEIEAALELLESPAPAGFEAAWAEARGDLHFERGRLEQARLAWQEALDHLPSDMGSPQLLQLKIDAAGQGAEEGSS